MELFEGNKIIIKQIDKPLIRQISKLKRRNIPKLDWSFINIYIIIGKSKDIKKRSLSNLIKKFLMDTTKNSLEGGKFIGRLSESFPEPLQKLKHDLLESGVNVVLDIKESMGIYGPIAGELRYLTDRIDYILPVLLRWQNADYFDLAYLDRKYTEQVLIEFNNNAFFYTEDFIFRIVELCNYFLRKSGDEDECEILSKDLGFIPFFSIINNILTKSNFSLLEALEAEASFKRDCFFKEPGNGHKEIPGICE